MEAARVETPQQALREAITRLSPINEMRSFFEEGKYMGMCGCCDRIKGLYEVHHVIFRQRARRDGAPQWSPDDAFRLCSGDATTCHEREHSHQSKIPTSKLRIENIAFACRWLGPGPAYNYFTRYYAHDGDPRIEALLELL
jgi:hypothetical protein